MKLTEARHTELLTATTCPACLGAGDRCVFCVSGRVAGEFTVTTTERPTVPCDCSECGGLCRQVDCVDVRYAMPGDTVEVYAPDQPCPRPECVNGRVPGPTRMGYPCPTCRGKGTLPGPLLGTATYLSIEKDDCSLAYECDDTLHDEVCCGGWVSRLSLEPKPKETS